MNNRIKLVRDTLGINQSDFARQLGVSRNFVWQLETGNRQPSNRTLSDICRIFDVDPVWLRTGEGEPFRPKTRQDEIAEILGHALAGSSTARDRLIRAFARLPDDAFPLLERYLDEMLANLQKERDGSD